MATVTDYRKIKPATFHCDACGSETQAWALKRCRGMKLCPECRELARDYFGR